jgi:universal stress protein E
MRTIKNILVGVEFTDAGRAALHEAALLARTFGAEVHLLHALTGLHGPQGAEGRLVLDHVERMVERLAVELESGGGVRVARPPRLPTGGGAASSLLSAAVEVDADLVLLGAGEKAAMDRVLLGATAEQVVRESVRPTWLVRPGKDHAAIRRILCAVDASDPAREALALAAFLARTFVAELHTLSVIPPRADDAGGSRPEASAVLRDALGRIDLHGIDHRTLVRQGKPAVRIVDAVSEVGADLLVLGSARRAGLTRLLQGSNTAEKVLRLLPCSLLSVPSIARDVA